MIVIAPSTLSVYLSAHDIDHPSADTLGVAYQWAPVRIPRDSSGVDRSDVRRRNRDKIQRTVASTAEARAILARIAEVAPQLRAQSVVVADDCAEHH